MIPETPQQKLMKQFESLGDACAFGMLQRHVGIEQLGLLRFIGFLEPHEIRSDCLIAALRTRFDGLAAPENVQIEPIDFINEYKVLETKYNLSGHAGVAIGAMSPEAAREGQIVRLKFLRRKLLADLEDAEKIFLWRSSVPVPQDSIRRLFVALREFGPNTLLWVPMTDTARPPGTVDMLEPGLLKGYIDRDADYGIFDHEVIAIWLDICRNAYTLSGKAQHPQTV